MANRWIWILGIGGVLAIGTVAVKGKKKKVEAWLDEFQNQHPRWEWGYQSGTGYHLIHEGHALIGIQPQIGEYYSDCALRTEVIYPAGRMEAVLQCTDKGLHPAEGTRGWGFWDGRTEIGTTNAAWFWAACEHSAEVLQGLQVNVFKDGAWAYRQALPSIDITQPHRYAVEIGGGSRFYVDGALVAETPEQPLGLQRIDLWIDNQSISMDGTIRVHPVLFDQAMAIDKVSYTP